MQVASLGLIKAVDATTRPGHAFLSYALPEVTGELRRHLRDRTATVRPPAPAEASGPVFQAVEELEQRSGGHSPTSEQIASTPGTARRGRSPVWPARGSGARRVVDTVSLAALVKRLPERDRRDALPALLPEAHPAADRGCRRRLPDAVSRLPRRCLDRLREALLAGEPCAGTAEETRGPAAGRAARPARAPWRGRRDTRSRYIPCGHRSARPAPGPAAPHPAGPARASRPVRGSGAVAGTRSGGDPQERGGGRAPGPCHGARGRGRPPPDARAPPPGRAVPSRPQRAEESTFPAGLSAWRR
ncbi:hypothetical protein GCM10023238_17160 [Streptomyces heliomycini]